VTENDGYSDRMLAEFLQRSYTAVDGLWFVKVEEAQGFDGALEFDRQVWEIMAKIQARKARELLDINGDDPAELARCFCLKLRADGHDFDLHVDDKTVRMSVHHCGWLEAMERSGREELAAHIGETVCTAEGQMWAREFGGRYEFSLPRRRCRGDDACEFVFTRTAEETDDDTAE